MVKVPDDMMTGGQLEYLRKRAGLTRTELGRRLDFSRPYAAIWDRETGRIAIANRLAKQIQRVCKKTIDK